VSRRATVVGARGFVGSAVVRRARALGFDVTEYRHDEVPTGENLGTLFYCSGVAWDADRAPLEAYDLHAAAVLRIARAARYDRIVYVSSTRVYDRSGGTLESEATGVLADCAGDVYALSKLAGEGIVLAASPENVVVRCSNVYGASFRSGLFLSDVLRQAATCGRIALRSSRSSSKDYVSVEDVATCMLRIGAGCRHRIYNVGAGRNTTHGALLDAIVAAEPVEVSIPVGAPTVVEPADVVSEIPALVRAFYDAFAGERLKYRPARVEGAK